MSSLLFNFLFQKYPYQLPHTSWARQLCSTGFGVNKVLFFIFLLILISLLGSVSLMGVGSFCNECKLTCSTH